MVYTNYRGSEFTLRDNT